MFKISKKAKDLTMYLMGIGILALIIGFFSDSHRAWPALLFNTYFFLGISLFAVFFIALQYVAEASWSIVLKRIPEAIISFLPITGIIMMIIVITAVLHFGGNHIYHWMETGIMDQFITDGNGNEIENYNNEKVELFSAQEWRGYTELKKSTGDPQAAKAVKAV